MSTTRGIDKGKTLEKLTNPQAKNQPKKLQVEKPSVDKQKQKFTKDQEQSAKGTPKPPRKEKVALKETMPQR